MRYKRLIKLIEKQFNNFFYCRRINFVSLNIGELILMVAQITIKMSSNSGT